jgi:hypothetical protein
MCRLGLLQIEMLTLGATGIKKEDVVQGNSVHPVHFLNDSRLPFYLYFNIVCG